MSPVLTRVSSGQGFSSLATYKRSFIARSAGGPAYQIARSLRFNSPDSAYLSRTPGSSGNTKTCTISAWVKRSKLGATQMVFTSRGPGNPTAGPRDALLNFESNDTATVYFADGTYVLTTTQVFRDVSSWYHIVIAVDTTQATSSNRIKLYVNGSQVTAFSSASYPTQNYDFTSWNVGSQIQYIGCDEYINRRLFFDGYLADIHFIDGQALTPSSFAETSSSTGQWIPKQYSGTYGTNGFKLNFSDNSGTTATTLGKDSSGNGLNWTPNSFSVTAGSGNDSLVDTPTSYGTPDTGVGAEVRGNYATLNPLDKGTNVTVSNGNLETTNSVAQNDLIKATIGMSSGKWYAEFQILSQNSSYATPRIGLAGRSAPVTNDDFGNATNEYAFGVTNNSSLYGRVYNNSSWNGTATAVNVNDIAMCAFDADTGKMWFGVNGTWFNSGNPSAGTNAWFTASMTEPYFFTVHNISTSVVCNFGQRAFAYTAPSGFKALCDTNLSAPTIAKSNQYFDVSLYSGNGTSQTISGLNFSPDAVWCKERTSTSNHHIIDTVRGATLGILPNDTRAEAVVTGSLTAFTSDGFTVGDNGAWNESAQTYAAWCWDASSSNSTNNDGSIQSTIRANTTSGFSIVTFTGSSGNQTIGHGLGKVPQLIILKYRNGVSGWYTYHGAVASGNNNLLTLNTANIVDSSANYWNSTAPTSTVFTLGSGLNTSNTWVAYCFAPVTNFSAFGKYTGNGSSDGPFIHTGMRPKWVLIKEVSGTAEGNWIVWDTSRSTFNAMDEVLLPNSNVAELGNETSVSLDVLSNGFKIRSTSDDYNGSGGTFVYAAFAENPFQYARAR